MPVKPSCLDTEKIEMINSPPMAPKLWLCDDLATKRVSNQVIAATVTDETFQFFVVSLPTVDREWTQ